MENTSCRIYSNWANMEKETFFTSKQASTFVVVFILLYLRISNSFLPMQSKNIDLNKTSFGYYSLGYTFILLAILIYINRDSLFEIHVDYFFYLIFVFTGILFWSLSRESFLGSFVGIVTFLLIGLFQQKNLNFGTVQFPEITTYTFIAAIPYALFVYFNSIALKLVDFRTQIYLVCSLLIMVAFWELVFRGVIWSFLKTNGLNELKAFLVQLAAFWFIFVLRPNYSISLLTFIPLLLGLWNSFLTWRTKSITPGVIAWFIFLIIINTQ
jgi:hypothetical protein